VKITKDQWMIGLICIVLGIFVAIQFKAVQKNVLQGLSPIQKSSQLVGELTKLKNERDLLQGEVNALEATLKEIEETESKGNVLIKNLNEDLNKYKALSGLVDVAGQGVEILIDNPLRAIDSAYEANLVYDYELLLALINELNAAGAEAISINDQRILSTTEIRAAGSNINVNKIPQNLPLDIRAIGSSVTLDNAISNRMGIVSELRDRKYVVEVKRMEKVTIARYSGIVEFRYAIIVQP
jgi:uncharacterized protein YlxW (UPF0749 family)